MKLENISRKQLNELEQQARQLMETMRKARLLDEPLFDALQTLAQALEKIRHEQFDQANSEYHTY
jgi:hypothetical protein